MLIVVVVSMGSTRCGRASSSGARLPAFVLAAFCLLLTACCSLPFACSAAAYCCSLPVAPFCSLLAACRSHCSLLPTAYLLLPFTYYQAADYRIHNECHSHPFTRIHTRRSTTVFTMSAIHAHSHAFTPGARHAFTPRP